MTGLLSAEVLSHIGRQTDPQREIVTRRDIRKYAVATGSRLQKYLDGDVAPPLFHLHLFGMSSPSIRCHPMACLPTAYCPSFHWKKPWQAVSISNITNPLNRAIG